MTSAVHDGRPPEASDGLASAEAGVVIEGADDVSPHRGDSSKSLALHTCTPPRRFGLPDLGEMWSARFLWLLLVQRDVRVRFKQSLAGISWLLIQPALTLLTFTALFALLGRTPTDGTTPYVVTAFVALLPWRVFASGVQGGADSLLANYGIISKVYFSRAIIPLVPVGTAAVEGAVTLAALAVVMLAYGVVPDLRALAIVPLFMLTLASAYGLSLWLSAAAALYRDARHIVPFALQLGMFVSPVLYESRALIPSQFELLYAANPMVGVIAGFRWSLLGQGAFPSMELLLAFVVVVLTMLSGAVFFRHVEHQLVDRM